jgi:hypothetical protein
VKGLGGVKTRAKNALEVLVVVQMGSAKFRGEMSDEMRREFEDFLADEGFEKIPKEEWAYQGQSTTPIPNTRAYIFETFAKAFAQTGIIRCAIITQIASNPYELWGYDEKGFWEEIKG